MSESLLCRVENLELAVVTLSEQIAQSNNCAYVTLWAEDNGTLVEGRWDYSWGNGNEHSGTGINDWGYVTHYPWELISMTIGMRGTNTAPTEVELTVNGAGIGQSVLAPGSTTKAVDTSVSHVGSAGETINFRTLQNGGGNDVVVSALIKYTLDRPATTKPDDGKPGEFRFISDFDDFNFLPDQQWQALADLDLTIEELAGMSPKDFEIPGIGQKRAESIIETAIRIVKQ